MGPEFEDSLTNMLQDLYFNTRFGKDWSDADARLQKVQGGMSFEIVLNMILTNERYLLEVRRNLAYKYAVTSRAAERWLLSSLDSAELMVFIEDNGIASMIAFKKNPIITTEHLIAGLKASVVTSQIDAIVDEIPQELWTVELETVMLDRLQSKEQIIEDIPSKDVLDKIIRKGNSWTVGLPDSWLSDVFYDIPDQLKE